MAFSSTGWVLLAVSVAIFGEEAEFAKIFRFINLIFDPFRSRQLLHGHI